MTSFGSDAQLSRAEALYAAGEYGQAEAHCRSLLQSTPECPEALYLLGRLAARANQGEAAMALIGQAIELRPDQPRWYLELAALLQALGQPETGLEVLRLAQSQGLLDAMLAEALSTLSGSEADSADLARLEAAIARLQAEQP